MNTKLHEMAYCQWIANNIVIKDLDNPKIKESLARLAAEWKFSNKEGAISLMKVIEGELVSNTNSQATWKYLESIGELDYFKKKVEWIQQGLDRGKFLV